MKNVSKYRLIAAIACLSAAVSLSAALAAQESHIGKLTGVAARGQRDFVRYCAGCHGVRGDGRGTFAPYLDPKPRDLSAGIFKLRSTPSGSLPTDQDLYYTLTRGIVKTAMPIWAPLTQQTRADLVAYVKQFSPRFAKENAPASIVIPAETPSSPASVKAGEALYLKLDCAQSHGPLGRGEGPISSTLIDIKRQPIPPYDLTTTTRYKSGPANRDLYRLLMTGLDGTPMPSYADKLTSDETWDMAHFIQSLKETHKR
jgi:mono/diheme cytochrome c family protein